MEIRKKERSSMRFKSAGLLLSCLVISTAFLNYQAVADEEPEREVFRFIVGSNDTEIAIWGDNRDVAETSSDKLEAATIRVPEGFAAALNNLDEQYKSGSGDFSGPEITVIVTIKDQSVTFCHWSSAQGRHCHSN